MERQGHARAESEWQHALDLEKKLKACSRWALLLFLALISFCCFPVQLSAGLLPPRQAALTYLFIPR